MELQFRLRMGTELRTKLEDAARRSGLSINKEIVKRLSASFSIEEKRELQDIEREQSRAAADDAQRRLAAMQDRVNALTDRLLELTSGRAP